MAGFDKVDPANSRCICGVVCASGLADDGRAGLHFYREIPARELDEGIAVIGEYALHRRSGAAGKVGVPTS